ncbi:MFS transporter [Caballeronia sp. EK]|uniref:MFS transporter n=1 Tax=Caballeronia sp. EK TaxID=2767469 RepID=UPI0016566A66|nr:MFS transporter [Caballeronia sp. EK]MBC8641634.1 MFS transporter [Caballeronia sp. EK]
MTDRNSQSTALFGNAAVALISSISFGTFASGLQGSVVALATAIGGYSGQQVSTLTTSYFSGYIAGSLYIAQLIALIGYQRTFCIFASLMTAATLFLSLSPNFYLWLLLRGLTGFCMAGLYTVVETSLNALATDKIRGRLLAVYMIVSIGTMSLGQLFLILEVATVFNIAAVAFSLSCVPILLNQRATPNYYKISPVARTFIIFRLSPLVAICCVGTGMVIGAIMGMGVVYASEIGLAKRDVALYMASGFLGSVILQLPIGRISDKLNRKIVISAVAATACLFSVTCLFHSHSSANFQMFTIFAVGGLSFTLYPLCLALVNDRLLPSERVHATSCFVFWMGLGAAAGSPLVAYFMQGFGAQGFMVFLSVIHISVCLIALSAGSKRTFA